MSECLNIIASLQNICSVCAWYSMLFINCMLCCVVRSVVMFENDLVIGDIWVASHGGQPLQMKAITDQYVLWLLSPHQLVPTHRLYEHTTWRLECNLLNFDLTHYALFSLALHFSAVRMWALSYKTIPTAATNIQTKTNILLS